MIYDTLSIICGLMGIVVFVIKLVRIVRSSDPGTDGLNGVWLCGLVGFLIGAIGQVLSIKVIFEGVDETGQPDFNAIASDISRSTIYSLTGLLVLTILLILWGLLKGLITYKKIRAVAAHNR